LFAFPPFATITRDRSAKAIRLRGIPLHSFPDTFIGLRLMEFVGSSRYPASKENGKGTAMADDLTDRGPRDRTRVDVNQDWELRYWTRKFGCTATELRDAVRAVGNVAHSVEAYLKKQRR
jgi:hypothetical protein